MTSLRYPPTRAGDEDYADEHFHRHRRYVVNAVKANFRSKGIDATDADIDAAYAESFMEFLQRRDDYGATDEEIRRWLIRGTRWRCIDELKRSQNVAPLLRSDDDSAIHGVPDRSLELDAQVAVQDAVRATVDLVRLRFTEREAKLVALVLTEHSRDEMAAIVDLPIKRLGKILDGNNGRPGLLGRLRVYLDAIAAGEWCEFNGSLIRAYALGLLANDGQKKAQAEAHVRQCSACRKYSAEYRKQLHEVLPPLWMATAVAGDRAGMIDSTVAAARSGFDWLRTLLGGGAGDASTAVGGGMGTGAAAIAFSAGSKVVAGCAAAALGCAMIGGGVAVITHESKTKPPTPPSVVASTTRSSAAPPAVAPLTLSPTSTPLQQALDAASNAASRVPAAAKRPGPLAPTAEFGIEPGGQSVGTATRRKKNGGRTYDLGIENNGASARGERGAPRSQTRASTGTSTPPPTSDPITSPPPTNTTEPRSGGTGTSQAEKLTTPTHETFGIER